MTTQNEPKILADGMRKLSQRLKSARPSADVSHIASELLIIAGRLWTPYISREISTPEEKERGQRMPGTVDRQGIIGRWEQRRGTNNPDELLPEHHLKRAWRILDELAKGKFAVDAAKELDGVANDLMATNNDGEYGEAKANRVRNSLRAAADRWGISYRAAAAWCGRNNVPKIGDEFDISDELMEGRPGMTNAPQNTLKKWECDKCHKKESNNKHPGPCKCGGMFCIVGHR